MSYMCACGRSSSCLCELHTPPAPAEPGDIDRATAADRAYAEGRWCGECQYGEVADPPCCLTYTTEAAAAREQGRAEGRQEVAGRMTALAKRYDDGTVIGTIVASAIRAALEGK